MANIEWPDTEGDGAGWLGGAAHVRGDAFAAVSGAALAAVRSAVRDGARLVDLGVASAEAIAAVRAIDRDVIICAEAQGADLTRDPGVAARTGATLLRADPVEGPPGGGVSGCRASILVTCEPADVGRLTAVGWAVVVDVDSVDTVDTTELAGTLAVAAVCTWLGARILRTRHVAAVCQAVEMVESIGGTRAPAWTRRGLA